MENPQDKKGHKTTYTCPHTAEHWVKSVYDCLVWNWKFFGLLFATVYALQHGVLQEIRDTLNYYFMLNDCINMV